VQAIKNYYTVKNNQIVIDLPKSFDNKRVEVIVLSADDKSELLKDSLHKNKQESLERLLSVSQWDEDDIKNIIDGQKHISQWKIEKF
jgi:hypothetical protein